MAKQPQYVMVTKQRRKSGCFAGLFHLFFGIFTMGLWPLCVWIAHLIGPKKKTVTAVYGPDIQPQPYPLAPPYAPEPPTTPWGAQTTPPPTANPYAIGYDPATGQWAPPQTGQQQQPTDPWGDAPMRRRS